MIYFLLKTFLLLNCTQYTKNHRCNKEYIQKYYKSTSNRRVLHIMFHIFLHIDYFTVNFQLGYLAIGIMKP